MNDKVIRDLCMTDYKRTIERDPVAVGDFIAGLVCGAMFAFGIYRLVEWWIA